MQKNDTSNWVFVQNMFLRSNDWKTFFLNIERSDNTKSPRQIQTVAEHSSTFPEHIRKVFGTCDYVTTACAPWQKILSERTSRTFRGIYQSTNEARWYSGRATSPGPVVRLWKSFGRDAIALLVWPRARRRARWPLRGIINPLGAIGAHQMERSAGSASYEHACTCTGLCVPCRSTPLRSSSSGTGATCATEDQQGY